MKLLVVNYHYIGTYNYPYSGINAISINDFQVQLQELGRNFDFITQKDLLMALNKQKSLPDNCCLITFDDGLKQQYTEAIPILEKLKIPAIFFICGMPYKEKKALTVHKIHWIRSHIPSAIFLEELFVTLDEQGFSKITRNVSFKELGNKYLWDDEETRKIKYLLNIFLPHDITEKTIDLIFKKYFSGGDEDFCRIFYMNINEILDIHKRNYGIGVHSYSHRALAKIKDKEIKDEITTTMQVIYQIILEMPYGISYPFGYAEAVNPLVAKVAASAGLKFGFTMERSFNLTLNYPLLFARIDTNDAPKGKKPLFSIRNGYIEINGNMSFGRTRYIKEYL